LQKPQLFAPYVKLNADDIDMPCVKRLDAAAIATLLHNFSSPDLLLRNLCSGILK
jgi:hypothetical protein